MTQFEYRTGDYNLICKVVSDAEETARDGRDCERRARLQEAGETARDGELQEQVVIAGVRGSGSALVLPDTVAYQGVSYPVCAVEKKVFLGLKNLRQVELPASVQSVGDWAFAQCTGLCSIRIPVGVQLGVGVFEDCVSLERIYVCRQTEDGEDASGEDLAVLLAACVNRLQGEDLLRDAKLGSDHWYQRWDQRLLAFLQEDDEEGYQTMILCGEEDVRKDVPEFILDKQMRKCDLCMTRILHDEGLAGGLRMDGNDVPCQANADDTGREADARSIFTDYIMSQIKGCGSEAAWRAIVNRHGEDMKYYNLLAELGGITRDNVDAMIEDLGSSYAEAKAYLIRYKQDNLAERDAFSEFCL